MKFKHGTTSLFFCLLTSITLAPSSYYILTEKFGLGTRLSLLISAIVTLLPFADRLFQAKNSEADVENLALKIDSVTEQLAKLDSLDTLSQKDEALITIKSEHQKIAEEFKRNFKKEVENHKISKSSNKILQIDDNQKIEALIEKIKHEAQEFTKEFNTANPNSATLKFDNIDLAELSVTKMNFLDFLKIKSGQAQLEFSIMKASDYKIYVKFESTLNPFLMVITVDLKDKNFEYLGTEIPSFITHPLGSQHKRQPLENIDAFIHKSMNYLIKHLILSEHS